MIAFDVSRDGRPTTHKSPGDVLDYQWVWTDWLEAAGDDRIVSFAIDLTGGLTEVPGRTSHSGGVVTAFLAGGTPSITASARCQITTEGGRVAQQTLYIVIEPR